MFVAVTDHNDSARRQVFPDEVEQLAESLQAGYAEISLDNEQTCIAARTDLIRLTLGARSNALIDNPALELKRMRSSDHMRMADLNQLLSMNTVVQYDAESTIIKGKCVHGLQMNFLMFI